jgi:hypothetical protein
MSAWYIPLPQSLPFACNLFGFISDKLVYRKNMMWLLAIIITLFAPTGSMFLLLF